MNTMTEREFHLAVREHVAELTCDPDRLLAGVRSRRRRRVARRSGVVGASLALVAAVGTGIGTTGVLDPGTPPTHISAFTVAATTRAPIATAGGAAVTYLPEGVPTHASADRDSQPYGQHDVDLYFGSPTGDPSVTVGITRGQGLGLTGYRRTHWLGHTVATTVGGAPALASRIDSDGAKAVVWSPRKGIVIFVGVSSGLSEDDLRRTVSGIHVIPERGHKG